MLCCRAWNKRNLFWDEIGDTPPLSSQGCIAAVWDLFWDEVGDTPPLSSQGCVAAVWDLCVFIEIPYGCYAALG